MHITVETGYIQSLDITVVFEQIRNGKNEIMTDTIINFYYGEPNKKDTDKFYKLGKLQKGKPQAIYY